MESEMTIQAKLGARLVRGGLLLLFLLARICYGGTSAYQIESLAVSPDGKVIAIDIKKGGSAFIYTAAVDTGVAARLTNAATGEETSPTFSADGKHIAFSYWPGEGARPRIAIVDVDGSNLRQWPPSGVVDLSPVLSPDNKTIVFARAKFYGSYSPIAQPHPHDWGFYAADLDGTNVRQITNEGFYMASRASISPDGKNMVVVTEGLKTNQRIAIYSIVEPGPATRSFQPHVPHEADPKHPIFAYPNYAPDGSILFMAASDGKHGFDYDVYRLEPETGTVERLTTGNGYATELKVSADGKTAAFLRWRKNWLGELVGNQVYLLDVQTRRLRPLEITGL